MIDNLHIVKPLLTFDTKGEFYMLAVLKRKKDQSTDKSNHQSSRTIKSYTIDNIEYLDEKWDEIKKLCEVFRARAYLYVQSKNHKDIAPQMIIEIGKRIQLDTFNYNGMFDRVISKTPNYKNYWVIDIDDVDEVSPLMMSFIDNECRPKGKSKIHCIVPTKSGFHLITDKFDRIKFKEKYPDITVQKNSPTLVYYPTSLEQIN